MDFIRSFDIRLDRDVYYAGEQVTGVVILENAENIKIRGVWSSIVLQQMIDAAIVFTARSFDGGTTLVFNTTGAEAKLVPAVG